MTATTSEQEARIDFKIAVLATDRGCVVHEDESECEGDVHAHHVVTQQQLRQAGREDLLWDPRNGATVCELAHRRHHRAIQRIPYDRLPERCIAFAREYGFDDVLTTYYARSG